MKINPGPDMEIDRFLYAYPQVEKHFAVQRKKLDPFIQAGSIWYRNPEMELHCMVMLSLCHAQTDCGARRYANSNIAEYLNKRFADELRQHNDVLFGDDVTAGMVCARRMQYDKDRVWIKDFRHLYESMPQVVMITPEERAARRPKRRPMATASTRRHNR